MIEILLFLILVMLAGIASNTAPREMNWYVPPYEHPRPRAKQDPKQWLAGIAIVAATGPVTLVVMWLLVRVQDLTDWRWLSW